MSEPLVLRFAIIQSGVIQVFMELALVVQNLSYLFIRIEPKSCPAKRHVSIPYLLRYSHHNIDLLVLTMKLQKGSHSVYSIHLHLVFVTKYRRKVITAPMLVRIGEIFNGVCEKSKSSLVEFNGESNHVHLLVTVAPDVLISQLVASLKSASSRIIRKEFADHINKFYWKPVFWHDAYCCISAGGAPLEVLKEYIKSQDSPT